MEAEKAGSHGRRHPCPTSFLFSSVVVHFVWKFHKSGSKCLGSNLKRCNCELCHVKRGLAGLGKSVDIAGLRLARIMPAAVTAVFNPICRRSARAACPEREAAWVPLLPRLPARRRHPAAIAGDAADATAHAFAAAGPPGKHFFVPDLIGRPSKTEFA